MTIQELKGIFSILAAKSLNVIHLIQTLLFSAIQAPVSQHSTANVLYSCKRKAKLPQTLGNVRPKVVLFELSFHCASNVFTVCFSDFSVLKSTNENIMHRAENYSFCNEVRLVFFKPIYNLLLHGGGG